ncbi:HlyD family efflux transporter periplasmic adaptor subunit [Candidatus Peregrinibacteria bacterium]|nr:HlyD family efflux transporter periplasmic adaptor subunit [Candidatus Peregrinibacteria bacterium]
MVKASHSVELAFEKGGKLANQYVKVGDRVKKNQLLLELFADDLYAQLNQAQAGVEVAQAQLRQYEAALESQQAKLAELERGTRTEEVKLSETKVATAQKSLADAETNLKNVRSKADIDVANAYDDVPDTLNDAYAKADDAARVKSSSVVSGGAVNGYTLNFGTCDASGSNVITSLRSNIEGTLVSWESELKNITGSSSPETLDAAIDTAKKRLSMIKDMVDRINAIITSACLIGDSSRNTDRTNIGIARSNINTTIAALNTQEQTISAQKATNNSAITTAQTSYNAAQNSLASARNELDLKKAGSTPEQLAYQRALVKQARANVDAQKAQIRQALANRNNYDAQVQKTMIVSPIDGIVSKLDKEVGEIVSANVAAVSVVSDAKFDIETNITEADIAKIKLGDTAKITLDAFDQETFWNAAVVEINPAETVIEGVSTYKTTLQFAKADEENLKQIKPGMTANIDILTAEKDGVLLLPGRSVYGKDGSKFVKVTKAPSNTSQPAAIQGAVETKVTLGLRGSDGNVEIIDGVREGDRILIPQE